MILSISICAPEVGTVLGFKYPFFLESERFYCSFIAPNICGLPHPTIQSSLLTRNLTSPMLFAAKVQQMELVSGFKDSISCGTVMIFLVRCPLQPHLKSSNCVTICLTTSYLKIAFAFEKYPL